MWPISASTIVADHSRLLSKIRCEMIADNELNLVTIKS